MGGVTCLWANDSKQWSGGWHLLDAAGRRLSPQFLFLPYTSTSVPYYVHGRLGLKGFDLIRLEVFTETDTRLEISIQDNRQRTYRAVRKVGGQVVTVLHLKPSDFLSDPEQFYRLKPLCPDEAGTTISVYDVGTANAFIPRRNRIVIHDLHVQLPEMPIRRGLLRVRDELEIQDPWEIDGDIIVEPGATLRIMNTDLRIAGRIISFNGIVQIENSRIDFMQNRSLEHGITINDGGQLSIADARLVSVFPLEMTVSGESVLRLKNTSSDGTFSFSAEESSSIFVEDCRSIGDFRYDQDSTLRIRRSKGFTIWLNSPRDTGEEWSLPSFSRVRRWDGNDLFPVEIENCTSVAWGLRLFKGSAGRLSRGHLEGVEIILREGEEADLNGVRNAKPPPAGELLEEGYNIEFGSLVRIGAWNFVAENGSSLVLRNSLFSSAQVSGRDSTLTIINSECSGQDGYFSVSLGSSCFIQHSTLDVPLVVSFGGMVRAFDSRITDRGIVENGGTLVLRDVEARNPVEKRPGGRIFGTAQPLGTFYPETGNIIPAPVLSQMEMGGIGTFLPRISGFEEYENTVIPHFEVEILQRFYIRFPEFEYVTLRRGSPLFASLAVKVAALFERGNPFDPEEEKKDILFLPLAFETGLRGRSRLIGPFWGIAEIAADPSSRIYSGFRFYTEIAALREIPLFGVESRLYTGVQFADAGYINDLYYPPDSPDSGLMIEKVSYGGRISRSIGDNWLVSLSCEVEDYVGPAAKSPLFRGDSFDWTAILALLYRMR
jgi:hypothetical protein